MKMKGYTPIRRPREGDTTTIVYCKDYGVPNPPCPCVRPCEGEHLITEIQVYRGIYGKGGVWVKSEGAE